MNQRNIKLTVAYNGAPFFGWQKTSEGPSIEALLEEALTSLLGKRPSLQAASRTDRGVHARGQVVNFTTSSSFPVHRFPLALATLLPKVIRVHKAEEVPLKFHSTLDAKGKEYHYHYTFGAIQSPFMRATHWHVHQPVDLATFERVCPKLVGQRDFSPFANTRDPAHQETVCHLTDLFLEEEGDGNYRLILRADRFLYKMARNLAGTILYLATGKLSLEKIQSAKARSSIGMTAPAHGLLLHKVFYD